MEKARGDIPDETEAAKASPRPANQYVVESQAIEVYPDQKHLEKTADSQAASNFFELPLELRQLIYRETWRSAGLWQHVYWEHGAITHQVCTVDHEAPDDRQVRRHGQDAEWARQLASPWLNHWKCRDDIAQEGQKKKTSFLTMLLSCKRVYLECQPSLYQSLTFVFTDLSAAHDYFTIAQPPTMHLFQSLQFSFRLQDIQLRQLDDQLERDGSSEFLWWEVCQKLSELHNLTSVSMWLDSDRGYSIVQLLQLPKLFKFPQRFASILTLNCPGSEESELSSLASIEPRFRLILRGYPLFRANSNGSVSEGRHEPLHSLISGGFNRSGGPNPGIIMPRLRRLRDMIWR